LRKVSGIEREITLPCGEQVIPFHEHGVELDGFHEERTGDDFAAEPAAGRRERRDCPSGERQVTPIFVRVRQKNIMENNKVVTLRGTMLSIWTTKMAWFWRLRTWSNGVLVIVNDSDW